jgi:hypothetical protein
VAEPEQVDGCCECGVKASTVQPGVSQASAFVLVVLTWRAAGLEQISAVAPSVAIVEAHISDEHLF